LSIIKYQGRRVPCRLRIYSSIAKEEEGRGEINTLPSLFYCRSVLSTCTIFLLLLLPLIGLCVSNSQDTSYIVEYSKTSMPFHNRIRFCLRHFFSCCIVFVSYCCFCFVHLFVCFVNSVRRINSNRKLCVVVIVDCNIIDIVLLIPK